MLRNYLKTAWRSLKRNKLFSGLNIFGLAIGMAGAMLIAILLQHMLSYDRFHKDEKQLYVISSLDKFSGELHAWKNTPKILGATLSGVMPEIENWTRMNDGVSFLFTAGEGQTHNRKGAYVDPGFFTMFSFPLESGSVNKDWDNGTGIVLSKAFARALFGKTNVVGQTLRIDTTRLVKVAAVLKEMPQNTDLRADYYLSWNFARQVGQMDSSWTNNSVHTYVKLAAGVDVDNFNNKIRKFAKKHDDEATTQIFLEPLSRNYLYNADVNGKYKSGRIIIVRCMAIIGILLLLVACINFMNLSTAQSEKRAKEVGVKKVIGATRKRLIVQFLVESILLASFAFAIAIGLVILLLPVFGNMVEIKLQWRFGLGGWILAIIFMVVTGLIAGSYPAFYLSSFKPIKILKGPFQRIRGKVSARSVLVVLQFTVAIFLMLMTIMIMENTHYARQRGTGYDQNELVFTSMEGRLEKNYEPLRNALLQSGAVTSVSKNMSPITEHYSDGWGLRWTGSLPEDEKTGFVRYSTDADMVQTMHMQLVKGRDIDIYTYPADSTAMILTESAVNAMRLNDPIGAEVQDNGVKWHVVGVIKDFIIDQPFNKVNPMVIEGPASWFSTIHYRLNPAHSVASNLAAIKDIFTRFNPQYPFVYKFADESYAIKFKDNKKLGEISLFFAGLTIFISCLGLFGLITYLAETKTKEIGIRKILGASIAAIIGLLSKGYIKLIGLSFIIAIPLSLISMNMFLSASSYHVSIKWWWFVVTVVLASVISFSTVAFQALKAARSNPVQSIKNE